MRGVKRTKQITRVKKANDEPFERFTFYVTPQTGFLGGFAASQSGMSFSAFVEEAVKEASKTVRPAGRDVIEFWDEHEGVRWCKIFLEPSISLNDHQSTVRGFVKQHWPYFYDLAPSGKLTPNRRNLLVLWPQIDELVAHHEKTQTRDAWATAEKMTDALKAAKLPAPEYGPQTPEVFS
jgi:hypothetical protein